MARPTLGGQPASPVARPAAEEIVRPGRVRARARRSGGLDAGPWTPYLFLAPYLVLFTTFVLVPAVFGIWISLHEWDFLLPNKPFVGLENYVELFTSGSTTSGAFWQSMKATGTFTLFSVPLLVVLPLGVALILNQQFPARNFFRAVFFAPYVVGVAVVGILWRFLLDPNIGVINFFLAKIGIDPVPWTTALPWAWIALVGMTVWWTLGFNAVIYLAGLQDIPRDLYEAAALDGANRWQQFRNVTIPGLRPVLVFVVTITILASANMFGQAFIVTNGRPGNDTRTAIMLITQEGLREFKMGNAAAMSFLLTVVLAMIGVANFVAFRERS